MWSQDTYQKAIRFAADAHKDQRITGSTRPYVVHLASVCMEVLAALSQENPNGLNVEMAMQVALLHDVLEDTDVPYDKLKQQFGIEVADGVQALTKDSKLDKSMQMPDSLGRVMRQPQEVWVVKIADRITNLQKPPRHWDADRRTAYRDEANLIHSTLGSAHAPLAQRLAQKIEEYGQFIQ